VPGVVFSLPILDSVHSPIFFHQSIVLKNSSSPPSKELFVAIRSIDQHNQSLKQSSTMVIIFKYIMTKVSIESFKMMHMHPYAFTVSISDLKFNSYSKRSHFVQRRQNSMSLLSGGMQDAVDEPVDSERQQTRKLTSSSSMSLSANGVAGEYLFL
jgi:hypothetical protein